MKNQIIFMHSKKFVCEAVLAFSKEKSISCYTIEAFEDFTYLINDLSPNYFYVDAVMIAANSALFWDMINSADSRPANIVLIDSKSSADFETSSFEQVITGDIDISSLLESIVK